MPQDLSSAVSLNGVVMNSARVVGPALGGALLGSTISGLPYVLGAILSGLAALCCCLERRPKPPAACRIP